VHGKKRRTKSRLSTGEKRETKKGIKKPSLQAFKRFRKAIKPEKIEEVQETLRDKHWGHGGGRAGVRKRGSRTRKPTFQESRMDEQSLPGPYLC